MAEAVRGRFGASASNLLAPDGPGHWLLDLSAASRYALEAAGVPAASIHVATTPTGRGGPFFSDRAARPCGRFALLVRVRPAGPGSTVGDGAHP